MKAFWLSKRGYGGRRAALGGGRGREIVAVASPAVGREEEKGEAGVWGARGGGGGSDETGLAPALCGLILF